jgi:hypothetical protein
MAQLAFGSVVMGAVVVKALSTDEHPDDKVDNEKSVCSGRDQAEISYSDMSTHRVHRIADEHKRTEDLIVYVGKGKWKGRHPSIADKRDPKKSQRWWISADKGRRKYAQDLCRHDVPDAQSRPHDYLDAHLHTGQHDVQAEEHREKGVRSAARPYRRRAGPVLDRECESLRQG